MTNVQLATCAALTAMSLSAHADFIVDTGPGTESTDSHLWLTGHYNISQSGAATFTVSEPARITDIDIWLSPLSNGPVTFSLLNGDVPTGSAAYSKTVSFARRAADWYGLSELGWHVNPGHWTLVVKPVFWFDESRPEIHGWFEGKLPSLMSAPAGITYWSANSRSNGWHVMDFNGFGLRIEAVSAVPEPHAFALAIGGLGIVAWVQRRRVPKAAPALCG